MASDDLRIGRERDVQARCTAAGIWARGVTERDQLAEPATAEEKLPAIEECLSAAGASLYLAWRGGAAVGFMIVVPREDALEICFLGVDPSGWGAGVGARLLRHVDDLAHDTGAKSLELWVLESNERARKLYERMGWSRTDDLRTQLPAGRVERRMTRTPG